MIKGPFKSKNFIGANPDYTKSEVVMVGLPFDSTTTNRPGARFAYPAIALASREIEENSHLFKKSMHDGINFFDAGELDLSKDKRGMIRQINKGVSQIYDDGKRYFGIGGEHLVSLPAITALAKKYGAENIAVVHFDAHGDMANDVYGEKLSHGTVMRRISEIIPISNIKQIGIRSAADDEWAYMQKGKTLISDFSGLKPIRGKKIFVSVDVDCLCPSVMPGTGTPVPNGMAYKELMSWLLELGSGKYDIVGADMVELSPPCDLSGASTNVATYLTAEMLFMMGRAR